ncbi:DUF6931 family protein [Yersinia enterocolitica]|uniref:DUF6931 family protein n=1 Tax=Yersinia enterocolitica TaxID=630 RepID=UPI00398CEB74
MLQTNTPKCFKSSNWEGELKSFVEDSKLSDLITWLVSVLIPSASSESLILLINIKKYLETPSSTLRWDIYKSSENIGFTTPTGLLGLALFLMDGSMSPEEYEPVYPPEGVVEQIIHCILVLLAVSTSECECPSKEAEVLFNDWCNYKRSK